MLPGHSRDGADLYIAFVRGIFPQNADTRHIKYIPRLCADTMLCLAHLGQIHQVFLPAMRPKLRAMPKDRETHLSQDAVGFCCSEQKKDKTHSNIAIMFHHAFCNVALHLSRGRQKVVIDG